MEALRNWLGAVDGVNLQSISESLQNLPQQIRKAAHGTTDGPCHRQGSISGDHNFNFSLHFEPRSDGGGLCQTGVLVASATARPDSPQPVPITCLWRRKIGSHYVTIEGIQSNMYHASADDIGAEIVCICDSATDGYQGKAWGVLGPFELDPITRMSLENLISSGFGPFPVRHFRDTEDPCPRDLMIHVTQEYVKVVHPGAERGGNEVLVHYTADYPKVIMNPLDTCKFRLVLSEDPSKTYHFVALSRTSRDLIALMIRCFHARQYVATSFILSRLFQNPATPGAPLTQVITTDFDVHALGERLGKELDRTFGQLNAVERVVNNANSEKRGLQEQLEDTINSYTQAIEKLHQQLSAAKGGPAASVQLQLHDARALHSRLLLEMQELKPRIEEEQQRACSAGAVAGHKAEVEALKNEISGLRASISSLAGDAAMNSQRDHTRAEELRRLRQDVEVLHQEKEGLERCVAQGDREKQDLIENFLYVKGCLDKLQMASLETPAASPEVEREVAHLKHGYSQMVDERNRLAVRVEALDRDREKHKAHRESALERVMNANARLLEERDRYEKEKTRVSELYQSTMGAIGMPEASGTGGEDASALEALRGELVQKTELLQRREQESESLRSRLRKLAMV